MDAGDSWLSTPFPVFHEEAEFMGLLWRGNRKYLLLATDTSYHGNHTERLALPTLSSFFLHPLHK